MDDPEVRSQVWLPLCEMRSQTRHSQSLVIHGSTWLVGPQTTTWRPMKGVTSGTGSALRATREIQVIGLGKGFVTLITERDARPKYLQEVSKISAR